MAAPSGCRTRLNICAVRLTRLNTNGSPVGGNSVGAVAFTSGISSLKWTAQYVDTDDIAEQDGCANLVVIKPPERLLKRFDVELDMLVESFELLEIATGATLITTAGVVVGVADLLDVACGSTASTKPGVVVEAWSQNYNCDQQDADFPWLRDVFNKVKFTPSDGTLARGANHLVLKGSSFANDNIGNGPFNDFPAGYTSLTHAGRGTFLDTALPTPSTDCGFLTTPSQS